jgi:hypothetical protein
MAKPLVCWNCGTDLDDIPRPISRHANCRTCFEELHCCRMCHHYRPEITGECDEDRADPPVKKEVANFCDWYEPRFAAYQSATESKRDDAKDKLDTLFGNTDGEDDSDDDDLDPRAATEPSPADEARSKLDTLFGDKDTD